MKTTTTVIYMYHRIALCVCVCVCVFQRVNVAAKTATPEAFRPECGGWDIFRGATHTTLFTPDTFVVVRSAVRRHRWYSQPR